MEKFMNNETNIANSLATAIAQHCSAFEQSAEFSEMVQTHVRKLYEKAIEDTFRWGKFPDAVQKALQDALPANISEMADLSHYNLLLARSLQDEWNTNAISARTVSHMQALVKDFIEQDQMPKFIKASDLWAAYIEDHQEEAAEEQWGAPQVVIDDDQDGVFYIGLEKEPHTESRYSSTRRKDSAYSCEVYLGFMQVKNRKDRIESPVMEDGHPVYRLFTGQLDCRDALGKKPVQFRSKFEKLVGALYYGDSLLVLDAKDADDIYYPGDY
jgi:hypothetical protein